jgi:hypothetical protein
MFNLAVTIGKDCLVAEYNREVVLAVVYAHRAFGLVARTVPAPPQTLLDRVTLKNINENADGADAMNVDCVSPKGAD